jgi:deoxyribose-phosphate aldolase
MKPSKPASEMSVEELSAYIDHSILKPDFTPEEVEREVRNAIAFGCKTVCINPSSIEVAAPLCEGTSTGICVVVDFPFGCSSTQSKVEQTKVALAAGVDELDIVANYGWIIAGDLERVERDLRAVIEPCHAAEVAVKVIFETDALNWDQIRAAAEASIAAGADFIKTSTGFYTGSNQHELTGAFPGMVEFMMSAANGRCQVKGSGAIRDREHFLRLIDMGVDRMGVGYRSTPTVLGVEAPVALPVGAGAY